MNEGVHVLHKCQATQNLILVTSLYKVAKYVYFTRPFGDVVFKKCIPKKKVSFFVEPGNISLYVLGRTSLMILFSTSRYS